jgi:hypothetical protein
VKVGKWVALSIALCMFHAGAAQAAEEEKAPPNPMQWEISVQPKPTAAELEAMRWSSVMENDTAVYECDVKSFQPDKTDTDRVEIMVKATYKDRKILDALNRRYRDRLGKKDVAGYSEMQIAFHLHDRTYAIPVYKLYSRNGVLLAEETKESAFAAIPRQSFAEMMYVVAAKLRQEEKT